MLISVSDNGLGLPTENADQIFNAFFTTKPQGSGMGLAISRSIVELHDGRLWATPNDGRGATFHFSLPSAAAEKLEGPATVLTLSWNLTPGTGNPVLLKGRRYVATQRITGRSFTTFVAVGGGLSKKRRKELAR